ARMDLLLPGQAALCAARGTAVEVGPGARVHGGEVAAGIYHRSGTGTPVFDGARVDGVVAVAAADGAAASAFDLDIRGVFGVSGEMIAMMADDIVHAPAGFPSTVAMGSVIVAATDLEFTASRPLRGHGVVWARGNVTFQLGSASDFRGLLFVEGDLDVEAPARIRGAVVASGAVRLTGNGSLEPVVIDYD